MLWVTPAITLKAKECWDPVLSLECCSTSAYIHSNPHLQQANMLCELKNFLHPRKRRLLKMKLQWISCQTLLSTALYTWPGSENSFQSLRKSSLGGFPLNGVAGRASPETVRAFLEVRPGGRNRSQFFFGGSGRNKKCCLDENICFGLFFVLFFVEQFCLKCLDVNFCCVFVCWGQKKGQRNNCLSFVRLLIKSV